jgi:hypothetical protein
LGNHWGPTWKLEQADVETVPSTALACPQPWVRPSGLLEALLGQSLSAPNASQCAAIRVLVEVVVPPSDSERAVPTPIFRVRIGNLRHGGGLNLLAHAVIDQAG